MGTVINAEDEERYEIIEDAILHHENEISSVDNEIMELEDKRSIHENYLHELQDELNSLFID